ncbi:hypothetical protein NM688_g2635 [Phlebia brevispora]|uniref:Uncharacterized protein n=1 Tax=Phlebia brevispora TaxID=194682 RepID=A0ACC1T852_9APHY|nr:hypothetical protein NM688_g2635 [Phlebia brevispora]
MDVSTPTQLLCAIFLVVFVVSWYAEKRRRLPLPPGPKPLPFFGNLFDVPRSRPYLEYVKWAYRYDSDVLFIQLPSQPAVILNTVEAARDLLDKRSSIYSDKPQTVMDELVGWNWAIPTMPYGHRWRQSRRYFHQHFHAGAVHKYREMQTRGVRAYLRRQLEADGGKATTLSVMHLVSAVIMDVTYGIRIKGMDDSFVTEIQDAIISFNEMKVPGAFWVNVFPFLKHLPRWVPGVTFHRYGEMHRPRVAAVREHPFSQTVQDMEHGVAPPSVMQSLIQTIQKRYGDSKEYEEQEGFIKDAGSTAYGAAVETTYATICWFILAMAIYPQVQEKAQRELDHVIGRNRLPEYEDLDSLPYIQALVLESLRWIPNIPMGVPHRVLEEDEYRGYRIPKGSTMIPNIWAMCHEEADYPNPYVFDPERFLTKDWRINPEVRDPSTFVFGFGRRICAGRYFAKQSLFLTISSVLSVYNVRPMNGEDNKPLSLNISDYIPKEGLFLHPERLDCVFVPRSAQATKLIRQSVE